MAYRKKKQTKDSQAFLKHTKRETTPPVVTVDYEKYAHFLEEADLTEDQKREFLQTIQSIIVCFIDLGFGVHPLQQACGQIEGNPSKAASSILSVLDYPDKLLSENFKNAAEREAELQGEGAE